MKTLPKQILYFDMDNVLVDFQSGIDRLDVETHQQYEGRLDEVPGIFALMDPMLGAVEAFQKLAKIYDVYILSTAPWENPSAWSDKLQWVKQHLGKAAYKRLILTHHKDLNKGAFLIDDRKKNGAAEFEGQLLQFGSEQFPDWASVVTHLTPRPKPKSYNNIKEILTLKLPQRKDTFLGYIESGTPKSIDEAKQYYAAILDKKLEELNARKYGDLSEIYEYDPIYGWEDDTQCFIFSFQDFDITIEVSDVSICIADGFNEVMAEITSTINMKEEELDEIAANTNDFEEELSKQEEWKRQLPDYIQALEFENECEFECLENTLDILFTEIAKCKTSYEGNNE